MAEFRAEPIAVPAGAWMRRRHLPDPRGRRPTTEPSWEGAWHLATGDLEWDPRWPGNRGADAVAACGKRPEAAIFSIDGVPLWDLVVADSRPLIEEACLKCLRSTGVIARWVVRRELVVEGGAS